jgi:hypothetical protein
MIQGENAAKELERLLDSFRRVVPRTHGFLCGTIACPKDEAKEGKKEGCTLIMT